MQTDIEERLYSINAGGNYLGVLLLNSLTARSDGLLLDEIICRIWYPS